MLNVPMKTQIYQNLLQVPRVGASAGLRVEDELVREQLVGLVQRKLEIQAS